MAIEIAFIGAGKMASAIVRGLLDKKHYAPEAIACTCGNDPSGPELASSTGIQYRSDITPAVREAETLVLACKPQQFGDINPALAQAADNKLVLSILAGTPLSRLQGAFKEARNIVRTMPNTPGSIGAGVTAFAPLRPLDAGDRTIVESILGALGSFHEVAENELDAITALSGSGPAYVFEFAAALRDAGVHAGLNRELARALAIDTLLGAARLLASGENEPEALRNAVTSPGGTTAAALKVLDEKNLRGLIEEAVASAKARSLELADGS
ncbi:MAG: pyrroline-5-carboxylate reductase [Opitutales bacterium]